ERRIVGDVHGRRPAGLRCDVTDSRAGDDAADLAAELHGPGEHAQRALRELFSVMLEEDEDLHRPPSRSGAGGAASVQMPMPWQVPALLEPPSSLRPALLEPPSSLRPALL